MAIGDTFKATTNEHLEAWANKIDSKFMVGEGLNPRLATCKLIVEVISYFRIPCSIGYNFNKFLFQFLLIYWHPIDIYNVVTM